MDNDQLLHALSNMIDKKFDEKLQLINNRFDKIESEVSELKAGQTELKASQEDDRDKSNIPNYIQMQF